VRSCNMRVFGAFLVLLVVVQATSLKGVLSRDFQSFRLKHNKTYKDLGEELRRMRIFDENLKTINAHNKRFAAGKESYKMGVNEFSDLLPIEFESIMLSSIDTTALLTGTDFVYTPLGNITSIPASVDWREKGAVTPVKNQGQCGSCWAFSTTAVLESHHIIKTQQQVSLSEQNLVDCTSGAPYYNYGCNGGWPSAALRYIKNNGGINTEAAYPYEGVDGSCRFVQNKVGAKVSATATVEDGNESALAVVIAETGPVSVCIDASLFQHYSSGVFNQPSCPGNINHAVVVVGYGSDNTGGDFWLVKNSWGDTWGENGYIRMARNKNNQCRVASFGILPII
ncbi:hypothetical protein KR222_005636, partial [Zaprionus bogoriensis]